MRKENHLKKTFNNAVENTIKRFSELEANDRYALLEDMGEWVFCDYDQIEIDYWMHKQYWGKKWAYKNKSYQIKNS